MSNSVPESYTSGNFNPNQITESNFNNLSPEQQQQYLNERRKYPKNYTGGKDEWIAIE
jgi:hypothetical protein